MLAQFRSAYAGGLAQFRAAYVDDAVAITVITDFDAGNVDPGSVVITNGESSTPTIYCDVRISTKVRNWRHFLFAVENAEGKSPNFEFSRASRMSQAAPTSDWFPVWTQDFQTWTRASGRTLTGGSTGTIDWHFDDPLPAGRVYVASMATARYADVQQWVADMLADYPGIVSPTASADASGVYYTSPAETDDIGRAVGENPMYAIKFAFGGSTTDGGPKRKLVLIAGTHAAGEMASFIAHRYAVDWALNSATPEAQAFRDNWDLYFYGPVTPNGVKGGSFRFNFRSTTDPNRDWVLSEAGGSLLEIRNTRIAIAADTGGSVDALLAWHTYGDLAGNVLIGCAPDDVSSGTRTPIAAAFAADLSARHGGETPTWFNSGSDKASEWGKSKLGAKISFEPEIGQNGSTALSRYQSIGESYLQTLQAVDADGWFYESAAFTLDADPAAYVLTGADATLQKIGSYALNADPAAYSLTGAAADLLATRRLTASPAAFVLTGADATLGQTGTRVLVAEPAHYTISGADASFTPENRAAGAPLNRVPRYSMRLGGQMVYADSPRALQAAIDAFEREAEGRAKRKAESRQERPKAAARAAPRIKIIEAPEADSAALEAAAAAANARIRAIYEQQALMALVMERARLEIAAREQDDADAMMALEGEWTN